MSDWMNIIAKRELSELEIEELNKGLFGRNPNSLTGPPKPSRREREQLEEIKTESELRANANLLRDSQQKMPEDYASPQERQAQVDALQAELGPPPNQNASPAETPPMINLPPTPEQRKNIATQAAESTLTSVRRGREEQLRQEKARQDAKNAEEEANRQAAANLVDNTLQNTQQTQTEQPQTKTNKDSYKASLARRAKEIGGKIRRAVTNPLGLPEITPSQQQRPRKSNLLKPRQTQQTRQPQQTQPTQQTATKRKLTPQEIQERKTRQAEQRNNTTLPPSSAPAKRQTPKSQKPTSQFSREEAMGKIMNSKNPNRMKDAIKFTQLVGQNKIAEAEQFMQSNGYA